MRRSLILIAVIAAAFAAAIAAPSSALADVAVFVSVPSGQDGWGTVKSNVGGVKCSSSDYHADGCAPYIPVGTVLTLTATGSNHTQNSNEEDGGTTVAYKFASWAAGGACAGSTSSTCTFTVGNATFAQHSAQAVFTVDPDWTNYPDCLNGNQNETYLCTDSCSRNQITGDGDTYYTHGYWSICVAARESGKMSIGSGKTHSHSMGDSSGRLFPIRACYWRSSSAVTPTVGISFWSATFTATNWADETRHWSFGAYYQTSTASQQAPVAGYSSDHCDSEHGCVDYGYEWGGCPSGSKLPLATPIFRRLSARKTWAPSRAPKGEPTIRLVNRTTRRNGVTRVSCPRGTDVVHADTAMFDDGRTDVVEPLVDHDLRTATFTVRSLRKGARVELQVVCREALAPKRGYRGGHVYGSSGGEHHASTRAGQTIFAGGGADDVVVTHPRTFVSAGEGDDSVFVNAKRVAVMGGPGEDYIVVNTVGRALIEGGSGNDTLIANAGYATINSEDGSPGDTIICRAGSHGRVYRDAGDAVLGPCAIARTRPLP